MGSYVTNRRGFVRTGFRPNNTNPFQAAHRALMSGVGNPNPFGPENGERLRGRRGLGDIVPVNAVVQYTSTWPSEISNFSPSVVLQNVVNALGQDGFHVISSSTSGGLVGQLFTGSFNVTITLQVTSGGGYSDPSDIAAIIDHEAYTAIGEMPSGSSAAVVANGTPGAGLPALPTDWNSWLQQNALWLGLGLVGIVLLPDLLDRI
jgi:hypothetical protein